MIFLNRETSEALGMESLYVRLMRLVRDLRHLEMSHGQLLLLQAIVLINTGTPSTATSSSAVFPIKSIDIRENTLAEMSQCI